MLLHGTLTIRIVIKQNEIFVNKNKLIFFHFHGLLISKKFFSSGFSIYNKKISKLSIKHLYRPYVKRLDKFKNEVNVIETRIRNTINYKNYTVSFIKFFKLFLKLLKMISF